MDKPTKKTNNGKCGHGTLYQGPSRILPGGTCAPIVEKLELLERRMAEVEERGLDYKGTFVEGTEYKKGDVLTHQGSIWIATRKTIDKPPGNGWLLSVKSGRV